MDQEKPDDLRPEYDLRQLRPVPEARRRRLAKRSTADKSRWLQLTLPFEGKPGYWGDCAFCWDTTILDGPPLHVRGDDDRSRAGMCLRCREDLGGLPPGEKA